MEKAPCKTKEEPPLAETEIGRWSPSMRLIAKLFDGFADGMRMSILAFLACQGGASVRKLVEAVGAPQPRVLNHLGYLAWCGYARARREGKHVYYSVADEWVLEIPRLGEAVLQDNLEHVEAWRGCGGLLMARGS